MSRQRAQSTLMYGRDELVERVARSRAAVLLLTGDSGVGKSEVLRHAQKTSRDAVAPAPISLDGSPGNLQRALMSALAAALATIARRRGLGDEIGRRVTYAALEVARKRADELAKALGAELLALVRHRLGPEVGQAITSFIKELKAAADADIGARINAASDPSIAQLFVALADELSGLAQGQTLILALDAAEIMAPPDRSALRDIALALPPAVRLRLAYATFRIDQRSAVDELRAATSNVQEVVVEALEVADVSAWLSDVGLDERTAARACRVTGGYPLLIQSVIAHARAGGNIEEAPLHQQFAAQTQLSWDALDPAARTCARRLAVLPDPLPATDCAALCEMSLPEYADTVNRLRRAFILATIVNGEPWFHEQRRAFVRAQLIPSELAESSARAAHRVLDHLKSSNDHGWVVPCAELLADAKALLAADPQLMAAVELPRAELAVAAALIELGEKQTDFVVRGDPLLRHARAGFGMEGDLVPALRRLAERDLVVLLERDGVAVAAPKWSLMAMVTVQGRAAVEFGRLPIPSLTTMYFALGLGPLLGRYQRLAYGVGRPSWTEIAQALLEPRKPALEVRASASLGELEPALLARGDIGGRPLYFAARYGSSTLRDEALSALDGLNVEVLGERLQVGEMLVHPEQPVASDRFVAAIERAARRPIRRSTSRLEYLLDKPFAVPRIMELKAQTLSLIRSRCSFREQLASDLTEPVAWHWLSDDDWVIEALVVGGGEGAVRHSRRPEREVNDPYRVYRLSEAFDLPPSAALLTAHHSAGRQWKLLDPIVSAVDLVSDAMREFNGMQRPLTLRLAINELKDALLMARKQTLADAQAFAEALPVLGEWREEPVPEALYLVLVRADPTKGVFYGEYVSATYEIVPSETGSEEAYVALIDATDQEVESWRGDESPRARFRSRINQLMRSGFDRDLREGPVHTGDARTLIASLLGYHTADIQLVQLDADGTEYPV